MRFVWFAAVAIVGVVLDLATKILVFSNWTVGEQVWVIPGLFLIEPSINPGAAFGLFPGEIWFFVLVSVVAIAAMVYFVATTEPDRRLLPFTLGLLLAGVSGNLYDRLRYQEVRDFIAVRWDFAGKDFLIQIFNRNQWPNFNLADSFICVGAALIIIIFWREERLAQEAAEQESKGSAGAERVGAKQAGKKP